MPQSLLAFLGIVLLATTAQSLMSSRVHLQDRAIARELEEMGSAVALEVMEVIRSRAFDQAVLDGETTGAPSDRDEFTYHGWWNHFSTNNECSVFDTGGDDCNDIDDFHRMETARLPFSLAADSIFYPGTPGRARNVASSF